MFLNMKKTFIFYIRKLRNIWFFFRAYVMLCSQKMFSCLLALKKKKIIACWNLTICVHGLVSNFQSPELQNFFLAFFFHGKHFVKL